MPLALAFVSSGAFVVLAGIALARCGDAIDRRTGLGGLWIGSVFLAASTSLPELATGFAAVRIGAPDLAVGDLFGASMTNMLTLVVVDRLSPRAQVLRRAAFGHALSACLAIALDGLAALFILVRTQTSILGIGAGSALLAAVYAAGMRAVFRQSVQDRAAAGGRGGRAASGAPAGGGRPAEPLALRRAVAGFLGASAVVLLAAPFFARSATGIADATGLGTTFVGTVLVGLSTSLPEFVSSAAAVRMGAFDLAVGNLFGSNALNMAILFVLDAAYPGGPILSAVSPVHAMTALIAIVLTSTSLAAVVYRGAARAAAIEPLSALVVLTYLLGLWLVFVRSAGM